MKELGHLEGLLIPKGGGNDLLDQMIGAVLNPPSHFALTQVLGSVLREEVTARAWCAELGNLSKPTHHAGFNSVLGTGRKK